MGDEKRVDDVDPGVGPGLALLLRSGRGGVLVRSNRGGVLVLLVLPGCFMALLSGVVDLEDGVRVGVVFRTGVFLLGELLFDELPLFPPLRRSIKLMSAF
jgi:hypothetical protein